MPLQTNAAFFLTRQSANIMEDLARRLKQSGSISLLHGVEGVGKSRLLQQFVTTRSGLIQSVLVRFVSPDTYVLVLEDDKEFTQSSFSNRVIDTLKHNSTLILDQFEYAQPEVKQEIFKLWSSTNALENGYKLVISIQTSGLKQLHDLAQSYHLKIETVELKPLNHQEQIAYLCSRCCSGLRQQAVISSELENLLKLTGGIFSHLEAFRRQHLDGISCKEVFLTNRMSLKSLFVYGVSVLLITVLTMLLFDKNTFILPVEQIFPVETDIKQPLDRLVELPSKQVSNQTGEHIIDENTLITRDKKLNAFDPVEESPSFENALSPSVTETVAETAEMGKAEDLLNQTFFQQRLKATRHWLASADKTSASIQIMTLGFNTKPEQSLNSYLAGLKSKQIDLNQIKIFTVTKGGEQMYGVLYGTFENLKTAYEQIKRLPAELKANRPLPRSVKGINVEINSE